MINIHDLENRWIKYKIKSYVPHIVIIISIITITTLSFVIFNDNKKQPKKNPLASKTITKTIQQEVKPVKQKIQNEKTDKKTNETNLSKQTKTTDQKTPNPTPIKKQEKKLLIKPSMNFIRDMQNDTMPYYTDDDTTENTKEDSNTKTIKYSQTNKTLLPAKTKEKEIIHKQKNSISINRQNAKDDIDDVIKRFKVNNNPALSLFIAKKYYELGEYNKSYNYALITNEINSDIEASWIVFAKSLVKLNEKEMAIKTLKTYTQHSGSNKAKMLLDEIISGKFK